VEYKTNDNFTARAGYAYFPNPQDGIDSDRQFISGGFSAVLTKGLTFDFGLQYSFWDDQNTLYSTPDVTEVVEEQVTRLNVMAGLRMAL
jgi:long-subunit fatty acid transport protein